MYDPQTLAFAHNPVQLIATLLLAAVQLITHRIFDLTQLLYNFPQLLVLPLATLAPAPLPALGGFAGLAGLAGVSPPAGALAPVPAVPTPEPAVTPAASVLAPSPSPAPAAAPAAAATPAAPPPAPPPPPPPIAGITAFAPPYLVGGPGIGSGSDMSAGAQARKTASKPDAAASAAAAVAREQRRAGRRRRAQMHGHGDEYMEMNIEVEPDWGVAPDAAEPAGSTGASDRGAGTLGFAGTAPTDAGAHAAGVTALRGDSFGGGPTTPMLPDSWEPASDRSPDKAE